MFRQLNFRSFFNYLGRNKLYTAINVFGLSLSLMFMALIADYTLRQLTVDTYHTKGDRIYIVGSEEDMTSGYYLQKYLRDRYPEIESTCAVVPDDNAEQLVVIGDKKLSGKLLYADTTFFDIFDFQLVQGDRRQALAARQNIVVSESFARKAFGTVDPLGQTIRFQGEEQSFTVSAVIRDIDRSTIPNADMILCAERLPEVNPTNNEHMSNAGGSVTFVLEREGADLKAKIPDLLEYFKEVYWVYERNLYHQVTLTPLKEVYFSSLNLIPGYNHGSWSFVMILMAVGVVILLFAVMNYINLTVAQTGFRAKEMAARRMLGASKSEVILKLILESTLMCFGAMIVALLLAVAVEPIAERLLESKIDLWGDMTGATAAVYLGIVLLLGFVAGVIPALVISRYKPVDIVRGTFRRTTKMVYSRVLITVQNFITIVMLAVSITVWLQIRHLTATPLGYNTHDILDVPSSLFEGEQQFERFREELLREPQIVAVGFGQGTPFSGGNNNTMPRGTEEMISFQVITGDSAYFNMLGLERLRDNHLGDAEDSRVVFLNQYAFRALGIDEDATEFKVGRNYDVTYTIAGIYRDFQLRSVLDPPNAVMLRQRLKLYPWNILVQTRGDYALAYATVQRVFERVTEGAVFTGAAYLDQQIEATYATQHRTLLIVGIFTVVALLISALGLVAISTYYIQQKQQEMAVRKVFGSSRGEVLRRLTGIFMGQVAIAFVVAVPVAWYLLGRWLESYSVHIRLTPWIFLAVGLFAAATAYVAVYWQSNRAAGADPIESIKN